MAKSRKSNIIAAVDIGSSKIACFIALREAVNRVKIIGIGHQISNGITSGMITDMDAAENSILSAVGAAEQMSGQTIDSVIINISGNSIRSHGMHVEAPISGREITTADIDHIISESYSSYSATDREVIHCLPNNYSVDGAPGIKNPRGMYGETLSSDLHLVTAGSPYLRNLANCLAVCHLDIEDCIVSAYSAGLACLTEDERELGAIVVDIGGGTTSIGVFLADSLIHSEIIPVGGIHITKDLARGLGTSLAYAERIKTLYGSAIFTTSDEELVDLQENNINLDEENHEMVEENLNQISKREIVSIINPRIEEILEIVKAELEEKGYDKIAGNRIILTGGTAQLSGIKELAGRVFGKFVRIGKPYNIDGLAEATKGPAFSSCVGMLHYALKNFDKKYTQNAVENSKKSKNPLMKFVHWVEENF